MRSPSIVFLGLLLAVSFLSAAAQTTVSTPPDPATVARLQNSLAQAEARGDWHAARISLRSLLNVYHGNPAMQAQVCNQLAQVSTQLHETATAAQYTAQAQKLNAQAYALPAPAQQPAQQPAPAAAYSQPSAYSQPAPIPLPSSQPAPPTPGAQTSGASKFARFMAGANKFLEQAQQMAQSKTANGAQPNPNPQPASFPAAPGASSNAQAAPAAGGVVIGYDANNQPIYSPAQAPAPAAAVTANAPAAGVVIGYDANNQPICAPPSPHL